MLPDYDWSRFEVHMHVRAPLARLWHAWSTARGLASFFIARAEHRARDGGARSADEEVRAGDGYRWEFCHPFALAGTFRAVEPGRRVTFSFGGMETTVALREVAGAVRVRLSQTGCRTQEACRAGDHLNCRSCWVFFLTNLKSVLEHGIDLRDEVQPAWTDSVSIYFQPEGSSSDPRCA